MLFLWNNVGCARSAAQSVRVCDGLVHEQGAVLDGQLMKVMLVLVAMWPAEEADLAVILGIGHDLHGQLARDLDPLRALATLLQANLRLQVRWVAISPVHGVCHRTLARSCTGC